MKAHITQFFCFILFLFTSIGAQADEFLYRQLSISDGFPPYIQHIYAEENGSFPDFSLCGLSSSDGKVAANPVQLCSCSADALHLRLRHLHCLPSDLESVLYPAGGRVHLLHPLFRCNCHHRGHRAVQ